MKNLSILILLFLSVSLSAQTVKMKLPQGDIISILQTIKQDMVYDTINTAERTSAVASCEKALQRIAAKDGDKANIEVPQSYILKWMERSSYDFEEYERARHGHDRFLRVASQLYEADPKLSMLKNDLRLEFVRRRLLRELKTSRAEDYQTEKKILTEADLDDEGNIK